MKYRMKFKSLFNPKLWFYPHFWFDLKYEISAFFNPRQKWLTSKIPNTFCDKVEILKIACFESIVNFVEEEDAFNFIDWEGSSERHAEAKKDFEKAYNLVKYEIPRLEKQLDDDWSNNNPYNHTGDIFDRFTKTEDGHYRFNDPTPEQRKWTIKRMDQETVLENLIQEACELVIKNRQYMWS